MLAEERSGERGVKKFSEAEIDDRVSRLRVNPRDSVRFRS
jgi:hypothetical protein